ncbi:MAG: L-seryl-tRNA(Sec) selenium transferase [Candidatus Cloacimonetes bacterium]|nr:L-seryl-tRNA(Sec) selenium transferase [Candidatus Cloacimonadota bacterium]
MTTSNLSNLRKLPSVDKILKDKRIRNLCDEFGYNSVKESVKVHIDLLRRELLKENEIPDPEKIILTLEHIYSQKRTLSLKKVINATGVILHTNLGRAPLGLTTFENAKDICAGYSNLEFNLVTGKRGHRDAFMSDLLQEVTGAESSVIVNNNAAAVMLILNTLAKSKEVIVSRGELIEIGGSFRIPEIMETSGAKMVEVGTTNKTRISDYEKAINENTKIILKVHRSNYFIGGFTEEAEIKELSELAKKHNLVLVYDQGSGLLRKPDKLPLHDEPDVKSALSDGADIVCFSGDKLLGAVQAGIIVGKKQYLSLISKSPLMRILRVSKLIISLLAEVIRNYLDDKLLVSNIPIFEMLNRNIDDLRKIAEKLSVSLNEIGIENRVVPSQARCGGGTLPHLEISSLAVEIILPQAVSPGDFHHELLLSSVPVLGVLREGSYLLDVMTLNNKDIEYIITALTSVKDRFF